jgi:hypothetical protein
MAQDAHFMLHRKTAKNDSKNQEDEFEIRRKPITRQKNTSPALTPIKPPNFVRFSGQSIFFSRKRIRARRMHGMRIIGGGAASEACRADRCRFRRRTENRCQMPLGNMHLLIGIWEDA